MKKTKQKLIKARLLGGLGNQLFIYAQAKYLYNKISDPAYKIAFELSSYRHNSFNTIEINNLPLSSSVIFLDNTKKHRETFFIFISELFRVLDFFYRKITKKLIDSSRIDLRKFGLYFSRIKALDLLKKPKGNLLLYGYFQNASNLYEIKSELVKGILITDRLSNLSKHFLNMIVSSKQSIAISVRCLKSYSKGGFHVYSPHFYLSGVQFIEKSVGDCDIFVFADDINVVRRTFEKKFVGCRSITFVENCSSCEQLTLMSYCNNYVISNSSFSWWGAFLGQGYNKKIVAPLIWWNGINTKDFGLFTSDMVLLDDLDKGPDSVKWEY